MLCALPGQDLTSNPFEVQFDMPPPESLLDCSVILGCDIEQWKLRFDPQCLSGEDDGEDGTAVYDCELHTPNVISNFGLAPIPTMLA